MQRFAPDDPRGRAATLIASTHVTIQNEVNGGKVPTSPNRRILASRCASMSCSTATSTRHWKGASRPEHPSTHAEGGDSGSLAGDLVESNEDAWLRYIHANMGSAAGEPRWRRRRLFDPRLLGTRRGGPRVPQEVGATAPECRANAGCHPEPVKPVYVTEYGVRKLSAKPRPGHLQWGEDRAVAGGGRVPSTPGSTRSHPSTALPASPNGPSTARTPPSGWGRMGGMIDAPGEELRALRHISRDSPVSATWSTRDGRRAGTRTGTRTATVDGEQVRRPE